VGNYVIADPSNLGNFMIADKCPLCSSTVNSTTSVTLP